MKIHFCVNAQLFLNLNLCALHEPSLLGFLVVSVESVGNFVELSRAVLVNPTTKCRSALVVCVHFWLSV